MIVFRLRLKKAFYLGLQLNGNLIGITLFLLDCLDLAVQYYRSSAVLASQIRFWIHRTLRKLNK